MKNVGEISPAKETFSFSGPEAGEKKNSSGRHQLLAACRKALSPLNSLFFNTRILLLILC